MRICGLDLETTGFNPENDRILELAYVITEHDSPRPLIAESRYVCDGYAGDIVSQEITDITGITNAQVQEMGTGLLDALDEFHDRLRVLHVQYIVAHNGENFDRPFLDRQVRLVAAASGFDEVYLENVYPLIFGPEALPWLDTRVDIEYPKRFRSHSLSHVACELGFLNPFPHMALSDVMTMLRVLREFDLAAIIARSSQPWVTLRALVSYDERDKAKARRFMWEVAGEKKFPRWWVKRVKASDVERERTDAGFQITIVEEKSA